MRPFSFSASDDQETLRLALSDHGLAHWDQRCDCEQGGSEHGRTETSVLHLGGEAVPVPRKLSAKARFHA
ncbi:hypothetical protein R1flu_010149 [Riccia fluitans]|uniref:Uncharacterized protein n=1 Tax=Riccia fluitans TaxID=41844 RepID=A0ABD1Z768_9MARC